MYKLSSQIILTMTLISPLLLLIIYHDIVVRLIKLIYSTHTNKLTDINFKLIIKLMHHIYFLSAVSYLCKMSAF